MVPNNRRPQLGGSIKVPYVEAGVQEVLRSANIVPFSLPHRVTAVFEGYWIPINTSVMFNFDSVLMDRNIFEDRREFSHVRFLDYKGIIIKSKEMIPFEIGRGVCLGEAIAKMELFLFITNLIQNPFHFW